MGLDRPVLARPADRTAPPGATTPGIDREQAFAADDRWVGYSRTQPGLRSGWHHHGAHDTYFYVVRGSLELEFGPGGRERVAAVAGDFALVPRGAIHREGTPPGASAEAVVVRLGGGPTVVAVDGPDPAVGGPEGAAPAGTSAPAGTPAPARPVVVPGDSLVEPRETTAGADRAQAFATDQVWVGRVRNRPHQMSGWHLHPGHDTFAYCVSGAFTAEFGAGGSESILIQPGDFALIPKGVVHREGNLGEEPNEGVVVRVGEGPVVVNVDAAPSPHGDRP